MGHDFFAGVEFVYAVRQITQRNQMSAEIADLIFVRLADVEDEEVLTAIETLLQFLHLHFGCRHLSFSLLAANSAELLVIN